MQGEVGEKDGVGARGRSNKSKDVGGKTKGEEAEDKIQRELFQ